MMILRRIILVGMFWLTLAGIAQAVEIQSVTSEKGITAWLIEDHTLPIISINFSFEGGNKLDPANKEGTADFVSAMLDEGAGPYDSNAFHDGLSELATSIGFDADSDYFAGSLRTLTQNKNAAFDLLHIALSSPRFEKAAIERIRSQFMAIIKQNESDPNTQAVELWTKTFFAGHPYGRIYDAHSMGRVQKPDLAAYISKVFNRRTLKVGVAGDITKEQLAESLDQIFGFLPDFEPTAKPAPFTPPTTSNLVVKKMAQPQTVAVFGQIGLKRNDPDFYPLYVFNHILGGGNFSSRLTKVVREDKGLAYSVYTGLGTMRDAGIISGSVATKRESFDESIALIRKIWAELPNDVTETDVDEAKQYLLGSFPLRFSSTPQISGILLALQQDDLGIDFFDRRNDLVRAVTIDDVRRIARKILNSDQLLFSVVGDYNPGKRE